MGERSKRNILIFDPLNYIVLNNASPHKISFGEVMLRFVAPLLFLMLSNFNSSFGDSMWILFKNGKLI